MRDKDGFKGHAPGTSKVSCSARDGKWMISVSCRKFPVETEIGQVVRVKRLNSKKT